MPGNSISAVEVTHLSRHGFGLLLDCREFFLPFEDYPWFRGASVASIQRVERPRQEHLHWPDLDVDLTVDSIGHPEKYPLTAKS